MKLSGEVKWVSCQEPNCNELFLIVKDTRKGARTNLLECSKTFKK